jgi:hypothetical protein
LKLETEITKKVLSIGPHGKRNNMKTFTFTFGSSQQPNGTKKCVLIEARDEQQAREIMFAHYGKEWCGSHEGTGVKEEYNLEAIQTLNIRSKIEQYELKHHMNYDLFKVFKSYLHHEENMQLQDMLGGAHEDGYELTLFKVSLPKAKAIQKLQNRVLGEDNV